MHCIIYMSYASIDAPYYIRMCVVHLYMLVFTLAGKKVPVMPRIHIYQASIEYMCARWYYVMGEMAYPGRNFEISIQATRIPDDCTNLDPEVKEQR